MTSKTTYLITGANRGIGLGLATTLLQRADTIVIATVRDKSTDTSSLVSFPKAHNTSLIILHLDSSDPSAAIAAIKDLNDNHGINTLDVVIANSAIANYYGPAASTPASALQDHFSINTVAPLLLFQACLPLLLRSPTPKFVAVSSAIASIGDMASMPLESTAYGASKAALNYVVGKIHYENEKLCAFVINPGWVQTQMGNMGAKTAGLEQAPVTVRDSVDGLLGVVDGASREETGGTFQSFEGQKFSW